jgi:phosphopantothenoylcysteine decarboxylase / phosphopantothenate---cysteine ligase
MIVANDITVPGAGFNVDTNIVKLLYGDGHMEELPKMSKKQLADIILDKIPR